MKVTDLGAAAVAWLRTYGGERQAALFRYQQHLLLAGLPAPEPQLDDSTTSVNNLTTGASKTQCEQVITLFFFCWRNTTTKAVYGVGDWPNKQASK